MILPQITISGNIYEKYLLPEINTIEWNIIGTLIKYQDSKNR